MISIHLTARAWDNTASGQTEKEEVSVTPVLLEPDTFKPASIMPVLLIEIFGHPVNKEAERHDQGDLPQCPLC